MKGSSNFFFFLFQLIYKNIEMKEIPPDGSLESIRVTLSRPTIFQQYKENSTNFQQSWDVKNGAVCQSSAHVQKLHHQWSPNGRRVRLLDAEDWEKIAAGMGRVMRGSIDLTTLEEGTLGGIFSTSF